jgi:TM2 domain-containing membrane protein YozV
VAERISKKERTLALVFAILGIFGVAGIHRFYAGKIGTGILWLLTLGWLYIGTIVDIVMIANGTFKDKDGAFVRR